MQRFERHAVSGRSLPVVVLLSLVLGGSGPAAAEGPEPGEQDLARIRELHRLSALFGDAIWPGFDTRRIPIAVNLDDKREILIGHPRPPGEYRPFGRHAIEGKPVLIRDGVSRYGPRGGGWAVELGGAHTAYVSRLQEKETTETYLSVLLHECFHVFQKDYRPRAEGATAEPPEDDAEDSASIGLESRVLHALLAEPDLKTARELGGMFVAVREGRRKALPAAVVRGEDEKEYDEGTATYAQARLYQPIARE